MAHTVLQKIIVLILVIIVFSHTQATIFARIGLSQQNGWIKKLLGDNLHDYTSIYISSIYWSIITMATVGYGDIHPVTNVEMIYVSIVSLISCGVFGYGLNSIGKILSDIQSKEEKFNRKMQVKISFALLIQILNLQMDSRNLDKSLQHTVRKYFEYLNKEEQTDDESALQMINDLPQSMKERILFDANHKILYSQKIFSLNFSSQFLDKLSLEMKSLKLGPEIDLFDLNKNNGMRVYFILKGTVEVSICTKNIKKNSTFLKSILYKYECLFMKKGDMLGIIEFMTQQRYQRIAKTANVVTLLYIDYDDFIDCIYSFTNDYEQFCMIRDKISVYNNYFGLDQKCQVCNRYNHVYKDCPFLNFQPNHQKLIYQVNLSQDQLRDKEIKRQKMKFNVFQQLQNIQAHSRKIQSMNIIQEYYDEIDLAEEDKDHYGTDKKSTLQLNNPFGTFLSQKQSTYKHVDWELPSDSSPTQRLTSLQQIKLGSKNRSQTQKDSDSYRRDQSRNAVKRASLFNLTSQQQQQQQQQQILINAILSNQNFNNNGQYFFPSNVGNNTLIQLQPANNNNNLNNTNGNSIHNNNVNNNINNNNLNCYNIFPVSGKSLQNLDEELDSKQIAKSQLEVVNIDGNQYIGTTAASLSQQQIASNSNHPNIQCSPFNNRSISRDFQVQQQSNNQKDYNFSSAINTQSGQQLMQIQPTTPQQQMQKSLFNTNQMAQNLNTSLFTLNNNNVADILEQSQLLHVNQKGDQIKVPSFSKQSQSNNDTMLGLQYQQLSDYVTLDDFDTYKNYKVYFTHNNINKILNLFNQTIKSRSTFKTSRIQRRFKKKKLQ